MQVHQSNTPNNPVVMGNIFFQECVRQGREPRNTRAFDLDRNPSPEWMAFRKIKTPVTLVQHS